MAITKLDTSWNVGASWNSGSANYTFRLEVIQESQNVGANQSVITVNKYVKGNSGNSWHTTACPDVFSGDISDTITYRPAMQGTPPNDYGPMRNTEVLYHQKEQYTINHNADGTKQITITTAFTNGGNSYAPNTNTKTFTVTLDTIPRASTISLNASSLNITGTSGTITWTATSKADYYHTLTWSLGSVTNQQITSVNHLNNVSVSGTIQYSVLLNALSASATGTLTLALKTYSNSAKTTQIGDTQTATCAITVGIVPTCELLNIFADTTPITNYAIAGYSTIGSDFQATQPYGTTGITTYFSIDSGSMATTSATGTSGTAQSNTLPSNAGTGTYDATISAYTVDSRGNRSTTVSRTLTCYQYTPPVANLTAIRTTQTGTTQDSGGSYLYVVFSGAVGASINGQNSVSSTTCTSTGGVSGSLTSGTHYSLSTDATAKVTLTVTDRVGGTNTQIIQVPTAVFPIDMYDDGRGTVGVGIGGIAPESAKCKFYIQTEGIDYNDLTNKPAGEYYGTCTTARGTVAKTTTITGFPTTLTTGLKVTIKFSDYNSATNPTLSINGGTAKAIKRYGTTAVGTSAGTSWNANSTVQLTYDGTNWIIDNWLNSTYGVISQANIQNTSGTNSGLITGQRFKQAYDTNHTITELYRSDTGLSGTQSATWTYSADYRLYIVVGATGSGGANSLISQVIPSAFMTTSTTAKSWQFADEQYYVSYRVYYSGTTGTIARIGGTGNIFALYGVK